MSITFTAGDEWWLERRTRGKARRQRYPKSIVVGPDPDNGRRYVPERTCRDNDYMQDAIKCSECGETTLNTLYWVESSDGLMTVKGHRPRFCSNCGARVVDE